MTIAPRYIIQANKNTFDRVKSLTEQFAKVASVHENQHKLIVEGKPEGYLARKLSKLHAGVYEDHPYDPYHDDPYHDPMNWGMC